MCVTTQSHTVWVTHTHSVGPHTQCDHTHTHTHTARIKRIMRSNDYTLIWLLESLYEGTG